MNYSSQNFKYWQQIFLTAFNMGVKSSIKGKLKMNQLETLYQYILDRLLIEAGLEIPSSTEWTNEHSE